MEKKPSKAPALKGKDNKASRNPFSVWGKKIDWERRVKAVCKPCWELKYCPYGPLVEMFPHRASAEKDSRRCRIFGHDCPVFYAAEPLTETKELRRVTREIPRPVQFRVLKRENQICSVCEKSVKDDNVHFDHIIPYGKGGSSDESNIRLLCDSCNLTRSDRFEAEYLVANGFEHLQPPIDVTFVDTVLDVAIFSHEFKSKFGRYPSAKEVSERFHDGTVTRFEEFMARIIVDFDEFFAGKPPPEFTKRQFRALASRWGFGSNPVITLAGAAEMSREDIRTLVILERSLLSRAGLFIKEDKHSKREWEKK